MKNDMYCALCGRAEELMDFMMERVSRFTVWDWSIFKLTLISFGALVGAACAKTIRKIAPLVALVFLVSWCYMIWRVFFDAEEVE